ncbi:MAG: lipid-A-disaccharide synthase [Thermodesulfovibrionaceae bacterium]
MPGKLLIVAGETSGELYGSLLAKALNDFKLFGIGGKKMFQAGVELVGEITHSFGVIEILTHLTKLRKNMNSAIALLKDIDGVVLIDFPDFNLTLAEKAKRIGKKVIYYVAPQIWAWRYGRIKKIKKYIDFVASVLPFEEDIYKKEDIPVKFVGHPITELLKEELGLDFDKFRIRKSLGIESKTVITFMPGSRPSEIKKILPFMFRILQSLRNSNIHFIIPLAPNIEFDEITLKKFIFYENLTILKERSFTALAASDLAVITSGTSTLQAALLKIPMIVVYKLNPISYAIGRLFVKGVRHISLPNIIADFMNLDSTVRVLEFIQSFNEKEVLNEIERLIHDKDYRQKIINFLEKIGSYFIHRQPSQEVAELCRKVFSTA